MLRKSGLAVCLRRAHMLARAPCSLPSCHVMPTRHDDVHGVIACCKALQHRVTLASSLGSAARKRPQAEIRDCR